MCLELMYLFLGFYVIGILGLQTFSKFSTIPEQIKKAPLDPVSKRCPKEEEDQEEELEHEEGEEGGGGGRTEEGEEEGGERGGR